MNANSSNEQINPAQTDDFFDGHVRLLSKVLKRTIAGVVVVGVATAGIQVAVAVKNHIEKEDIPFYSPREHYFPDGLSREAIIDNPDSYVQMSLENGVVLSCAGRAALYEDGIIRSAPFAVESTRLPADTIEREDLKNPKLLFVPESEQKNVSPFWYYMDSENVFINERALETHNLHCKPTS